MFLLLSIDVFLLKKYYGSDYVAFYAIGIKLITILSVVMISFNINASQQIAEFFASGTKQQIQVLTRKTAKKIFLINLGISAFIVVFLNEILMTFGEAYLYIKQAIYVLLFAQLFASAFGMVPVYLNMTGRGKIYQLILLVALLLNGALNMILIPKFNVMGAAYTFALTVMFWNIVVTLYVYKKDKINLFLH